MTDSSGGFTASEVVKVARGEIGTAETGRNLTKYGDAFGLDGVWWCGIFVWWVYNQAGYDLRRHGFMAPRSTNALLADAEDASGWRRVAADHAEPGDMVLYDFGITGPGNLPDDADHCGIVSTAASGGRLHAVEGNTSSGSESHQENGDGVFERSRSLSLVKAAFRPPFDTTLGLENNMFIAHVPGPDARVFLIGVEGKRLIESVAILQELQKIGIPDKGDVSFDTLNMFPTLH